MVGQRTLAALALTVTAVAAVPACNPNPDAARGGPGGAARADRLTVARTGDVDVLDPAKATAFQTVQTLELVYDRLINTDSAGNLTPGLAQKWDVVDDGRTVLLTLRQGVHFHDGSPLTAADAKATLERNIAKETGSAVGSYLANVDSIETDGAHGLILRLARSDASLLTALTYSGNSIVAKKDIDAGRIGKNINGTGPYTWRRWEQGRRLELGANAAYWNGAPKTPTLEFRVIPDEASVLAGMKAGGFDLGLITDPVVARQARGGGRTLLAQPTLSYHVLMLNARRGPLKDVRVRQAIACAINRQEIVNTVYSGQATVTGPITSPAYRYDPVAGLSCRGTANGSNPGGIRQMLAEAGHDGFELKTIVMLGEYSTSTNVAQSVQAQLAKVGVRLTLERLQTGVYVERWKKGDFDAAVALNGGSVDPYLIYNRYFTEGGSLASAAGLSSSRLDGLLAEANATANVEERRRVFGDLQRQLLTESPWVWLFANQMYYVVGKGVTGFKPLPTESLESLRRTRPAQ